MERQDAIPISLVCDYLFCPRRAWLELQGEKVDSAQMQAGFSKHQRVDIVPNRGSNEASAIDIMSNSLGLSGRTDVVRVESEVSEYVNTRQLRYAEKQRLLSQCACSLPCRRFASRKWGFG
jgi:CRISPR-associated protein Cas1